MVLLGCLVVLGMKAPGLLGGSFSGQPEEMEAHLGPVAQDLIKRAFADMGVEPLEDYHAHLIGIGTGDSHAEVNPDMMTWWHPVRRLPAGIFTANPGLKAL